MNAPITQIKPNPKNPRVIKDANFEKLKLSIQEFPEMLEKRPLVCYTDTDGKLVVLGGNMRLKAAKDLGVQELPVILADDWTAEQKEQFIIRDNVSGGEWDWEALSEWEKSELAEWGVEGEKEKGNDDTYTSKVESPIYQPKGEKPEISELYSLGKYKELMDKIGNSDLSDNEKLFLQLAATRHIEFNYRLIAEYYAHSESEMQDLIENSALVIIDYDKAIELGFVKLFETFETLAETDA